MTSKKTTVYIHTFGCQMNENDSEIVAAILLEAGFALTDKPENADIALLNTCAVRKSAENKALNFVHIIKKIMNPHGPQLIGMIGCMAQIHKQNLINNRKNKIDLIAGPDQYRDLPKIITKTINHYEKFMEIKFNNHEVYNKITPKRQEKNNAWVTIIRGCNNYCAYCIVPYARGPERCRAAESIFQEVKKCVKQGFQQITLLGQNVNSYADNNYDFPALLDHIAKLAPDTWIRFTVPHPKDFPLALLDVIAKHENICKHIHLPLQSGSSRILKLMNRPYPKEHYLNLADLIREKIPTMTLSTDIIVGFPTETETDFQDSVDVFKQVQFEAGFIFKYSPRPNTHAAKHLKDDVSEADKTTRIMQLIALQKEIGLKKNQLEIGAIHKVLIEHLTPKKNAKCVQGRTHTDKIVIIPDQNYRIGDFVTVKITHASAQALKGIAQ